MSSDRVYWIEHKGKKILCVDYSNATAAEVLPVIEESRALIVTLEKGSTLQLVDVSNADYDKKSWQTMRQAAKDTTPNTKAWAILGVEGAKKFLLKVAQMVTKGNIKDFTDLEEAKDWLASLE